MRFRILILCLLSLLFTVSCNHYENEGDAVYYKSWNEAEGSRIKTLYGVDPQKFHVLKYDRYAKDDRLVFFDGDTVKGADAKSFEAIGEFYGRDKYRGYSGGDSIRSSKGATFKIIDSDYSTDGKDIFYDTIPLKVVSVKKFKFVFNLGEKDWARWTTDGKYYYFMNFKVPSGDYGHMILYKNSGGLSKDRNWVYFRDHRLNYDDSGKMVVDTIDVRSFKVTGYLECRDKYGCFNVFHGREKCDPGH